MLDQNTDRMWIVMGAVLIAPALFFLAFMLFEDELSMETPSYQESEVHVEDDSMEQLEIGEW